MGVVEVEDMRADAVDQRRVQHVHPLGPAEDARLGRPAERSQRIDRDRHRLVPGGADGAAEPVQEGAQTLMPDIRRQVLITGGSEMARQQACHRRRQLDGCGVG
jgi:hypothetical protein